MSDFSVRPTTQHDAEELSVLLNEIVSIGGTTARQKPITAQEFCDRYVDYPALVSCFCAQATDGTLLGFQSVDHRKGEPEDWGDIATFAKVGMTARGIGSQLFAQTLRAARDKNLKAITAHIRADNVGGLKYYSKMGFEDFKVYEAVPLIDGTPVDRICKRLEFV